MSPKATNSIDTYVAGKLRNHRKQLGLSQADIAKQLGVTFQQIQKYEAGLNRIGAGRLFQFASIFGIPMQELFPRNAGTADGIKRAEKMDEVARFALSAEGWQLCEAFLRIQDSHQRRKIVSLVQQMAEE